MVTDLVGRDSTMDRHRGDLAVLREIGPMDSLGSIGRGYVSSGRGEAVRVRALYGSRNSSIMAISSGVMLGAGVLDPAYCEHGPQPVHQPHAVSP